MVKKNNFNIDIFTKNFDNFEMESLVPYIERTTKNYNDISSLIGKYLLDITEKQIADFCLCEISRISQQYGIDLKVFEGELHLIANTVDFKESGEDDV